MADGTSSLVVRVQKTLIEESMAVFSPCERYRYVLSRCWEGKVTEAVGRLPVFLMLNPSTADEMANDPTVERCQRRAKAMGYPGLIVLNLFAFRATSPKDMRAQHDPAGPRNDEMIETWTREAPLVICAWGNHGAHLGRSKQVKNLLREAGITLYYLEMNGTGEPKHPLYVGYEHQPKEWIEEGRKQ